MSAFLACCCVESILGFFFLSFIGILLMTGSHSIHVALPENPTISPSLSFFIAAGLNLVLFFFILFKMKNNDTKQQREQELMRQRLATAERMRIASSGSVGPSPLNTSGTVL